MIERLTRYSLLEKGNDLVESTKETAHEVSAKAEELAKSAEHKLAVATNAGKDKILSFRMINNSLI